MKLAIVIPAYNEEFNIKKVCKDSLFYGDVLVFDDYSTDNTVNEAKNSGAKVFLNKTNIGYEKNLYKGILTAKNLGYSHVITIDADGQHNSKDIVKIINFFKEKYQLVIGVRNFFQRDSEKYISILSKHIFNITDPLCGLKGYDLDCINNFDFDLDDSIGTSLAIFLIKNNISFKEFPININSRLEGKSAIGNNSDSTNYYFIKSFIKNLFL